MNLEALFNAVIVKPHEIEEKMYGNIVVPDVSSEKNKLGEVVSVGPGTEVAGIGFVKSRLQPGDLVVLPSLGFTRFDYEGDEYFIGKENDVLAKIKE
jgi:co-chaperonin GroES (HSP10)